MKKIQDREIYSYLKKIPGFKRISDDQDFFDFLDQKRINILLQVSQDLVDLLFIDKPMEDLTEEELKKLGINTKAYEIFMIVDEKDKIVRDERGLPIVEFRKNCHVSENNEINIHRVSDFLVVNKKSEILLGDRTTTQDTYGGFVSVLGGHCGTLSYEDALKKEFKEELGLNLEKFKCRKLMKYRYGDKTQSQFISMYEVIVDSNSKFEIDFTELDGVNWYNVDELIKLIIEKKINIIPHEQYLILQYIKKNNLSKDNIDKILEETLEKMNKEKIYITKI